MKDGLQLNLETRPKFRQRAEKPFTRGKNPNNYDKTRRGLGYSTPSMPSEVELKQPIGVEDGRNMIDEDSDISTGAIFQALATSITSRITRKKTMIHLSC